LGGDLPGEFAVGSVTGPNRDDMTRHRFADQCQVADDIENFVTDEFFVIAKRLVGEHGVLADDNGVLETAATDQPVLNQEFDLFVKAECSGGG